VPVAEVRAWPIEDQLRHIIALGKIGELVRTAAQKQTGGRPSSGGVHIVNRGGRHCLVDD